MNRSYNQGLGLQQEYNMMFFVCTDFFIPAWVPDSTHFYRKKQLLLIQQLLKEVPSRFELENKGFADLRLTAWLWHRKKMER